MSFSFEVTLEMVDYALTSATVSQGAFLRTQMYLDPGQYDGATYYFEVVGTNTDSTHTCDVQLQYNNSGTWTNVTNAVASLPTSCPNITVARSAAFTPISGKQTYAVMVPATVSAGSTYVYAARIIVVQTNPTKTRIQFPLEGLGATSHSSSNTAAQYTNQRYSTTYGQNDATKYGFFTYNASDWVIGDITGVALEGVAAAANASYGGNFGLAPFAGSVISGSTQATPITSTTPSLYQANFNVSGNFTDGVNYQLVLMSSGTTTATAQYSYRAALYFKLSNANGLTKVVCPKRMVMQGASGTSRAVYYYEKVLYTDSHWSADKLNWSLASYGVDATNENNVKLIDLGTSATATTGSDVGNAINYNGTNVVSVGESKPTDGHYYGLDQLASAGTAQTYHGLLVAKLAKYQRINSIVNPSMEGSWSNSQGYGQTPYGYWTERASELVGGVTHYSWYGTPTVSQSTSHVVSGTYSWRCQYAGVANDQLISQGGLVPNDFGNPWIGFVTLKDYIPCGANVPFICSVTVYTAYNEDITLFADFWDSNWNYLAVDGQTEPNFWGPGSQTLTWSGTTPANCAYMDPGVSVNFDWATHPNIDLYIDAFLLEFNGTGGDSYFDGSFANCGWTGTANQSSSYHLF